jgi:predicted TIM-barrel fold metal-dependent hydrolase
MMRLILGGVMEKYPKLKFITHHCGGMIPFFIERFATGKLNKSPNLSKLASDYLHDFYGDTVLGGNTSALMCGYEFFGSDHMVFASDYPFLGWMGEAKFKLLVDSVEKMDIPEADKYKIFYNNSAKLLSIEK